MQWGKAPKEGEASDGDQHEHLEYARRGGWDQFEMRDKQLQMLREEFETS